MIMRTLQLGVFLALLVAARAVPAVVDVSDALGRPLQYDESDRQYTWMQNDDDDDHPVNGKYTGYLPSDLGLNLDVEVDEDDHESECRVEHLEASQAITANQYIIIWKDNVEVDCKMAVYPLLDTCSGKNIHLGRGLGLINGFGLVASRNKFMNCIVRNHALAPPSCTFGGKARKLKALFKDCDLDIPQHVDMPVQHMPQASTTGIQEDVEFGRSPKEENNCPDSALSGGTAWNLDRIDDRTGLDQQYDLTGANAGGNGATVYVVDTGVNINHEEFQGRASEGWSAFDDEYGARDCFGHGSHCAGTVAGRTYGVAKAAKIVSVRVLNCEGVSHVGASIKGYEWVVQNHKPADGPAIISASLGSPYSRASNKAAHAVTEAGVTLVVAAGNENKDTCRFSSPASAGGPGSDVITVGSTSWLHEQDERSGFSNYGKCTDILAPGSNIKSVAWQDNTGTTCKSGTSMATPAVAGAAATILAQYPWMTPNQVKAYLLCSATANKIDLHEGADLRGTTPNLLLYVGTSFIEQCVGIAFTSAPTPPTPPPTPSTLFPTRRRYTPTPTRAPTQQTGVWYCVSMKSGKWSSVMLQTWDLAKAQAYLGEPRKRHWWSSKIPQAIMPMPGRRASDGFWAGDPRTLPMSWSGGRMFWNDLDDVSSMRRACGEYPSGIGQPEYQPPSDA